MAQQASKKKRAIRRLRRGPNGNFQVYYVDVETGQEISDISGYTMTSADGFTGDYELPEKEEPAKETPTSTYKGGENSRAESFDAYKFLESRGSKGPGVTELFGPNGPLATVGNNLKQAMLSAGVNLLASDEQKHGLQQVGQTVMSGAGDALAAAGEFVGGLFNGDQGVGSPETQTAAVEAPNGPQFEQVPNTAFSVPAGSGTDVAALPSGVPTNVEGLAPVSFDMQGKRNQMPAQTLLDELQVGVTSVYGPDYSIVVKSGAGNRGGGENLRHPDGIAADVIITAPDGHILVGDELAPIGQHWLASQIGSVGMPGPSSGQWLHLDLVGGNTPDSRPFKGDEGPFWPYGAITQSQRLALDNGSKGQPPNYVIPPNEVRQNTQEALSGTSQQGTPPPLPVGSTQTPTELQPATDQLPPEFMPGPLGQSMLNQQQSPTDQTAVPVQPAPVPMTVAPPADKLNQEMSTAFGAIPEKEVDASRQSDMDIFGLDDAQTHQGIGSAKDISAPSLGAPGNTTNVQPQGLPPIDPVDTFNRMAATDMKMDQPSNFMGMKQGPYAPTRSREMTALLESINWAEGEPSENQMFGYNDTFDPSKGYPNKRVYYNGGKDFSTAAGLFQINKATYNDFSKRTGIFGFDRESQYSLGESIAKETYRSMTGQDLDEVLASGNQDEITNAITALSGRWASLPGGSQQLVSTKDIWNKYQERLSAQPVYKEPSTKNLTGMNRTETALKNMQQAQGSTSSRSTFAPPSQVSNSTARSADTRGSVQEQKTQSKGSYDPAYYKSDPSQESRGADISRNVSRIIDKQNEYSGPSNQTGKPATTVRVTKTEGGGTFTKNPTNTGSSGSTQTTETKNTSGFMSDKSKDKEESKSSWWK